MSEALYDNGFSPEVQYPGAVEEWYSQLTTILLSKGAAEADGSYYTAALDDDTYASVTNYATASCHVNYRIDSKDRSQRASLEAGDPIITVEFRHIHTDEVKQGFVFCKPEQVRHDSIVGAWIRMNHITPCHQNEFVILSTSDGTEVTVRDAFNSPLYKLVQSIC